MRSTEVRDRPLSNYWVTWRELGDLGRSSLRDATCGIRVGLEFVHTLKM
jgi:hypothetical protein